MAAVLTEVSDGVHLAWTPVVNWTLLTSSDGVVLVDAGYPRQRDDVLGSLSQVGFGVRDLRAVLLTHAHVDHFGSAIWLARHHGVPVYCHATEVGHAQREYLEQVSVPAVATRLWRPAWLRWTASVARLGGLTRDGIPTAAPLTAEVAATLPGSPHAVPSPGHTAGHCSYVVGNVLIAGDALVTGHPVSARRGPQLLDAVFNHDGVACERSLRALALLDTDVLIPGHGEVWRQPIREVVDSALG